MTFPETTKSGCHGRFAAINRTLHIIPDDDDIPCPSHTPENGVFRERSTCPWSPKRRTAKDLDADWSQTYPKVIKDVQCYGITGDG